MEKIERILTECITDIKSGQATLAQCLERYPARRVELEPLLTMALNIRRPAAAGLDSAARQQIKAGLMARIGETRQAPSFSLKDLFSFGLPPRLAWARAALTALLAVILVAGAGAGTVYASQDTLPGQVLYPVKTGFEDVRIQLSGTAEQKAALYMEFARLRLTEMVRVTGEDSQLAEQALTRYRNQLEAAQSVAENQPAAAQQSAVLQMNALALQEQLEYCEANQSSASQLTAAAQQTVNRQIETYRAWGEVDLRQAVQANLETMQNRLERAAQTAAEESYGNMQTAMLQYREFSRLGEDLLAAAQAAGDSTAEIENTCRARLQEYQSELEDLYAAVPLEYQAEVQAGIESTLRFQTRTQTQDQTQDGESAPGEPSKGSTGTDENANGNPSSGQDSGNGNGSGSEGDGAADNGADTSANGNADAGKENAGDGSSEDSGNGSDSGSGSGSDNAGTSSGGTNSGGTNSGGSDTGTGSGTDNGSSGNNSGSGDTGAGSGADGSTGSGSEGSTGNNGGSSGNTNSGSGSGDTGSGSTGGNTSGGDSSSGSTSSGSGSGSTGETGGSSSSGNTSGGDTSGSSGAGSTGSGDSGSGRSK